MRRRLSVLAALVATSVCPACSSGGGSTLAPSAVDGSARSASDPSRSPDGGTSAGSCMGEECAFDAGPCPDAGLSSHVDHCGSCSNRCADTEMCIGGDCASAQGSGASCASPFVWDLEQGDHSGFRLSFAPTTTLVHPCGPLTAVPTKWFRFTSPKSSTSVAINPDVTGDQVVLTVFSSSACDGSVVVGCSNDTNAPKVDVPNAQGKTFYVAVGAVSVTAGAGADMRVDK